MSHRQTLFVLLPLALMGIAPVFYLVQPKPADSAVLLPVPQSAAMPLDAWHVPLQPPSNSATAEQTTPVPVVDKPVLGTHEEIELTADRATLLQLVLERDDGPPATETRQPGRVDTVTDIPGFDSEHIR